MNFVQLYFFTVSYFIGIFTVTGIWLHLQCGSHPQTCRPISIAWLSSYRDRAPPRLVVRGLLLCPSASGQSCLILHGHGPTTILSIPVSSLVNYQVTPFTLF